MLEQVLKNLVQDGAAAARRALPAIGRQEAEVVSKPTANALRLSPAARQLASRQADTAVSKVVLGLRPVKDELAKIADMETSGLRRVLQYPKDVNSNPHGATNGINISINRLKEKLALLDPASQEGKAWLLANQGLLTSLDRLQEKTNLMQLQYNGGHYNGPDRWVPLCNLPYANEALAKIGGGKPKAPTVPQFTELANEALTMLARVKAALKSK